MNLYERTRKVASPNYDLLPLATFDLGFFQAVFPLPENCGSVATELASREPNLDEFLWLDPEDPGRENCFVLISDLSWNCYSVDGNVRMGSLRLAVGVMDNRGGKFNFFDENSFKEWMLMRNQKFYGTWNDELREEARRNNLEVTESELFVYPRAASEISVVTSNGVAWYKEKVGCHEGGTNISNRFRTALNEKYSLNVELLWSATTETYEAFKAEVDDLQLEYLHKVRLIPNS